jgi:hypothetical protein
MVLATELGMQPLMAHCHLDLGVSEARAGKRDSARAHLVNARAMYEDMKMDFWRRRATDELAKIGDRT